MKKKHGLATRNRHFAQALMRYSILSCLLIEVTAYGLFAQNRTISLNLKDVPIITVIEALKKQTTYRFSYNVELETILKEKKVTINVNQETIEYILNLVFKATDIAFKVADDNILLSKKNSGPEAVKGDKMLMQTVKGRVIDKESKVPLVGVSIALAGNQAPIGTTSDTRGIFSFKVPVGMQSFKFTYIGYEENEVSDISVISGKETFLNIEMRESVVKMNEVIVNADKQKDKPINSMATVSARQLTTEDASRYAAGYFDPARMVSSFAGVMAADDGRNDIVIRGNSPMGLLWKLEGIEIPNPNHFNNGQGDAGGVFSIISSDVLTNSDFFTGAFPAEYGNATSGILDLNMRKGNPDKREYGIQVGMIGSQVSLEGPLGKDHNISYLFNYRYGNLQFLNKLNLLGLDKNQQPPVFQDLNFNINFHTNKAGTLSLFGVGGVSSTGKVNIRDSISWKYNPELRDDQTEDHKMGVVGIKHTYLLPNNKTFLKTIVAVTDQYDRLENGMLSNNYQHKMNDSSMYSYPTLRSAITLNHKFNAKHTIRAGLIYSHLFFDIFGKQRHDTMYNVYINEKGGTGLAEAFLEWKWRLTDKFEINSGIHNMLFLLNHDYSLEPRLGLKWQASTKSSFSYGFGLHSKVEPISVYFSQVTATDGTITTPNKDLKLTKAMHHVIGYDLSFSPDLRLKVEFYYQYLYDVPVIANPNSTYAIINSQYGIPDSALQNKGKGYNKGIEITLEKFYANNYYFLITGSMFDSKYKAANGQTYNTYFNTNYQTNFLAGKDFKMGKTGQNIFSVNFKTLVHGGFRYSPEAFAKTPSGLGYLYPVTSETYSKQTPYYLRLDMGLKYRQNNPRYSWIISLDVQNLTNRQNIIDYQSTLGPRNQIFLSPTTGIGIVPVLNFKVEF